ncbi:ABC transporter permease [Pseudochelatococcus sp. B33]
MTDIVSPPISTPSVPWLARLQRAATAFVIPFAFPALLVVLWHLASTYELMPEQILPYPIYVWEAAVDAVVSGDLLKQIGFSAGRVTVGFIAGAAAGLLLGFAMGFWQWLDDHVRPLFTAISQVPTIGWIPLLMLFLGLGETLKIVIIAKAAFIPIVMNSSAALRSIPPGYIEVARIFRFNKLQRLRLVILPATVPPVFTGIRYGLTKAWTALVAVELLASSEGLGYQLNWARQMFWLDTMIFSMILIGLVGFLMDHVLARIEIRLQRWKLTG